MKNTNRVFLLTILALLILFGTGCELNMSELNIPQLSTQNEDDDTIQASGTVEAVEVVVSSEGGGRVSEVFAKEGDRVEANASMFRIEDKILESQLHQVESAVAVAQANYDLVAAGITAEEKGAAIAAAQLELTSAEQALESLYENTNLLAAEALRTAEEAEDALEDLLDTELQEALALQAIADAEKAVETTERNYNYTINTANQADIDAQKAQVILAEDALEDAIEDYEDHDHKPDDNLERANFLARKSAAQQAYNDAVRRLNALLSTGDEVDIAVAEANLATAKAQLADAHRNWERVQEGPLPGDVALLEAQIENAYRDYEIYKLGPDPDDVELAVSQIAFAQAQLALAEADRPTAEELAVAQAQIDAAVANLEAVQVLIDKLVVTTPISGVVTTRNVETGELIQPGVAAMTISQLDELTVTVYIPENQYGQIFLGDKAELKVDSFPFQTFEAIVTRIADQAEYTPRNVQTQEERQTTVYAVELSVNDPDGKLKPGMPTDVVFERP